jgi:hypothetical protein
VASGGERLGDRRPRLRALGERRARRRDEADRD